MIMGRYGLAALKKESAESLLEKSKRIARLQREALYQELELVEDEKYEFQKLIRELEKEYHAAMWTKMPRSEREARKAKVISDILDAEEIIEQLEARAIELNSKL